MSYEIHTLPSGETAIFSRAENRYVPGNDSGYLAWLNLRIYQYTTEMQDQEVPGVDEEGNPITITIQVPVQVPVMGERPLYNEAGEQIGTEEYHTYIEPNKTPRTIPGSAQVGTYGLPSPPTIEERVSAIEEVIMEVTQS